MFEIATLEYALPVPADAQVRFPPTLAATVERSLHGAETIRCADASTRADDARA